MLPRPFPSGKKNLDLAALRSLLDITQLPLRSPLGLRCLRFLTAVHNLLLVIIDVSLRPQHIPLVLLELLDVVVQLVTVPLHKNAEDQLHTTMRTVQKHILQGKETLALLKVPLFNGLDVECALAQQSIAFVVFRELYYQFLPCRRMREIDECLREEYLICQYGRRSPF